MKSQDSATSGDDGFRIQPLGPVVGDRPETPKAVVKERRHQIPGLRQTSYLKIFFLRCDDNEAYKTQARQQVRAWIKEHTPPAQSTSKTSAQENHDAFEWMIVHVIVPNTAAATQPRTSGKGVESSSGSASDKASTARWRGGSSSTILDKLRADFNGSSRSSVDRIAQIRIGINDVPYDMLPRVVPAIPGAGSYFETPQENEASWTDLIAKFKLLILASFDMRVGQYEEDIREKDAQRTLPGWNFCTFFVLKEGLGRGFENVGLVEDALVGYDELSVGLDAIIQEQATKTSGSALSFLPFTEDLKRQAERARNIMLRDMGVSEGLDSEDTIDLQSTADVVDYEDYEIPLNASKKRYRELILANDISIFDFRCYVFARQLSLLLRLANVSSSREELLAKLKEQRESSLQGVAARFPATQPSDDVENLAVLGEICKRSMDFVASIGHIIREDLNASFLSKASEQDGSAQLSSDLIESQVVDNIVSSFTFAIAQQILAQTSTKALPIPPSTLAPPTNSLTLNGLEPKAAIPEPKTMMHPARSSSLALRSSSREPPSPGIFPGARRSSVPDQGTTATVSPFLKNGLEQLATHRAGLYLLSRNILEAVGRKRGWSVGWNEISHLHNSGAESMDDVDLEDDTPKEEVGVEAHIEPSSSGVSSKLLLAAIDNKDDFYRLYETLTDKALRHYTVASHMQSVQSAMSDLAILKYYLKDFAAAASYFYRMVPFYGDGGWTEVELSMLVMYANCLRELQRKEEFVKVVLKLLARAAVVEKERLRRKSAFKIGGSKIGGEFGVSIDTYLPELLKITKTLQHEVRVPLVDFFGYVEVDSSVRYHSEMDSMALQIQLQYLLPDEMTIDKARIRMIMISGETGEATRELWLETDKASTFKKGIVKLSMQSNVSQKSFSLRRNVLISIVYHTRHVYCQLCQSACQQHNILVRPWYQRTNHQKNRRLLYMPKTFGASKVWGI